jgi:hypothetical protein
MREKAKSDGGLSGVLLQFLSSREGRDIDHEHGHHGFRVTAP